eukprot:4794634-Heterocapsa_arctica.AAC.1
MGPLRLVGCTNLPTSTVLEKVEWSSRYCLTALIHLVRLAYRETESRVRPSIMNSHTNVRTSGSLANRR